MSSQVGYTERVLDQEIDTIELCPRNRSYMIVGTYSLVKREQVQHDDQDDDMVSSSLRIGSIRVLPIDASLQDDHLPRLDFPCAILDIRFCPYDDTLLGAATSIGELRFFRVVSSPDKGSSDIQSFRIIPVGTVQIYQPGDNEDESVPPPLITQFAWLSASTYAGSNLDPVEYTTHYLATCDTTGQATLVQLSLPPITSTNELRESNDKSMVLPSTTHIVHKHMYDLEAWTISAITLTTTNMLHQVLLSGGDDSCVIASSYKLNLLQDEPDSKFNVQLGMDFDFETPPYRVHLDKRTHNAGVVSILPLSLPLATRSTNVLNDPILVSIPVLTGSYDQHLRLYYLDPATLKLTPAPSLLDLELEGGVWRINVIDTYLTPTPKNEQTQNYVLLISAMHAGCYIVRLTCAISENGSWIWDSIVEVHFKGVHQSMVYACAAVAVSDLDDELDKGKGRWKVVSTSFYDKRICVGSWADAVRLNMGSP